MNPCRFLAVGYSLIVGCCSVLDISAEDASKHRLHGYVGGPYKVAILDVTGDKLPDVVLGYRQLGIVSVLKGEGHGRLAAPVLNAFADDDRRVIPNDENWSAPHVHNLAFGDMDGDGLVDLLISVGGLSTTKPGRIILARNGGQGRFEPVLEYATPSQAKGVRLTDLDRDGQLDLMYTARGSGYEGDLKVGRLYVRQGLGGWKFGPARVADAGKSAYFIETSDLNGDGYADILIPNEHAVTVTYFMNPGQNVFSAKTPLKPLTVAATRIPDRRSHAINDVRAADFNGDRIPDLVTANLGTSTVSIFPGNGDGTFQKDTLLDGGKNGAFLAVGDLDSDGDNDFVIAHWTEDFTSVLLNDGTGRFAARRDYKTGSGNYGVDVGDLNGDGHLDIVTANYREKSMSVLMGIGDGSFRPAVTTPQGLRLHEGRWIAAKP